MDDILAQYRRKGATPARVEAPPRPAGAREPYEAFNAKDNQRHARLDIRPRDDLAHALGYNFIIEICYDRREYKAIMLVLSSMLVKIRGRNLRPIVNALRLGTCEFIEEFDPERFEPPGKDDPLVERIEVVTASQLRRQQQKKQEA